MSAATPKLDEIWNDLSVVLENIFRLDSLEHTDFISQKRFMELYNAVEKYFSCAEYENSIFAASQSRVRPNENANENREVELPGGGFYYRIKNFFKNCLQAKTSNNNGEGEVFLEFYAKTWEAYQKSSQIANSILGGVNKGWVVRQQRNKAQDIHDIFTVAMLIWQDIFFKDSNNSLSRTCLELINRERNGEKINARLIKQVISSYVSAGFTTTNAAARSVEQTLSTYVKYFEKSFLEATEQYYKAEVTGLLAQDGVINYAKKVYKRFEEEENRVTNILHRETLPKVQAMLTEILIENQVITLQEELIRVLKQEKLDDIALLFNLVNRIPSANDPVIKELEAFAKQECLAAIQAIKATANKDPKCYCEAIIGIYLRFSKIVQEGFSNHQGYCSALDKAFGSAVNNNAVTQEAGRSIRSAELLSAYCDMLLRKGNKIEDLNMEEKFDHIMIMFNYIEDKDAFGKFYGKRLAKRLVNQLSASDDFEESMILKLKDKCGFEYTSKLQRMFEDISLSKNLISEYKSDCGKRSVTQTVDFDVMVLRSNAWPFSSPAVFNVPIELRRVVDSFTHFYTRTHTGRKLEWIYQHCRGELQTLFTKPKYLLQLSTYQMTILVLFNFDSNLTVETIQEKTKIDDEVLRQVLLILLKSKILKCLQINPSDINDNYSERNIQSTFDIQVNESFKSGKVKINLNAPLRAIEKSESDRDTQQIDEERKFVIQAAIVRIMKARKEMKHALLMQEVIEQLSSRFQPKVPMIKKCIDMLIEKEYLERDNKERDLLRYLA